MKRRQAQVALDSINTADKGFPQTRPGFLIPFRASLQQGTLIPLSSSNVFAGKKFSHYQP